MSIFDFLTLICGLSLFLFGMQFMGDSLKKSAGNGLKKILSKMTSNPVKGFLLGFAVTAVIQSSSATTVMVVGFVNSGAMTLVQSVGVIMGANLGAAVTFWLTGLSGLGNASAALQWLKPSSWMPILALIGILLVLTVKRGKKKDIGCILLGFAVLMVGMEMMGGAVGGLKDSEDFNKILTVFNNPVLGLLTGVIVTAAIQSSAASVGILQSLSVTGAITYGTAIPIIMGQNIGTCITALLSSFGANKNGKRAAFIHLFFNVFGAVFWLIIYVAISAIFNLSWFNDQSIGMFGIALVHTIFKVLSIILMGPFYKLLAKLSEKVIKDDKKTEEESYNLLDERLFTTPTIAANIACKVANDMAIISAKSMKEAMELLIKYDAKKAEEIRSMEEKVDLYEDSLGSYLVKLSSYDLNENDSRQVTQILHLIGDFERISDHAVDIVESCEEINDKELRFSVKANHEIMVMKNAVNEILDITIESYTKGKLETAVLVEPLEQVVDDLKDHIKKNHVIRLQNNECDMEHGFVLSDILTHFERVSDHCSNIAGSVIEISQHGALDLHRYLTSVKSGGELFETTYKSYLEKYSLETSDVRS